MISSVFDYSLDYVLGCYGLLMLLAAIEVYRMRWRDVLWYPWKWLSSFAILQTIHAWSVVASVSIGLEHIYCVTGFYMLCLSFLCLLEFGVRSTTVIHHLEMTPKRSVFRHLKSYRTSGSSVFLKRGLPLLFFGTAGKYQYPIPILNKVSTNGKSGYGVQLVSGGAERQQILPPVLPIVV